MRNASWMGESHDSAVEVDDTSRAVICDPQPRADDVDLVNVSVYVGRLVPLSRYALHSRSSNMVSQCS